MLLYPTYELQTILIMSYAFSSLVLSWFALHGRKDLPWQQNSSPYRVWVSEIMLQQTQVNTVIPYFVRFMQQFPDIAALANAKIDTVLALWAGLGYYARARNLHRTAQIIQHDYAGQFPQDLITLQSFPGIGRSTAGAIMALSMQQRAAILDGNVKRVLARFHAVPEWPGKPAAAEQLWAVAEKYTPQNQVAEYTQAMMDLGAMVCTRSKPKCTQCPLQNDCRAYAQGTPTHYPIAKPRKQIPVRNIHLLLLHNHNNEILLEKRPPTGIWGGLWSLPECPVDQDIQQWCQQHYYCSTEQITAWPAFRHTFSHFHLDIIPIVARIAQWQPPMMESTGRVWYNVQQLDSKGVAAPVKLLLTKFKTHYL